MPFIEQLKKRRDTIQGQLDRWIARGFRGGGGTGSGDATPQETAVKVAAVADLHRVIAEQKDKDGNA